MIDCKYTIPKIKQNIKFRDKYITIKRQRDKNRVLRDLITRINDHVLPYVKDNAYDILGKFYTQFIRYAGSDSKTGLVLTPAHIAELFCDLADCKKMILSMTLVAAPAVFWWRP